MGGLDENFISDLEVWCRSSSSVSRALIVLLCFSYLEPEFLVLIVEVYCKIPSSCGGETTRGVP